MSIIVCSAQDYDDEGPNDNNNQADNNDNYAVSFGAANNNDDSYNNNNNNGNNMPNYHQSQNVDSDGSNNNMRNSYPQAGSDVDGDYEGDDGSAAAAASSQIPTIVVKRVKRSITKEDGQSKKELKTLASEAKLRVKRHGKYYIGPVYTYVKTDKHAHFKWGVSTILLANK